MYIEILIMCWEVAVRCETRPGSEYITYRYMIIVFSIPTVNYEE